MDILRWLFQFIVSFFPKLVCLKPNEAGVRITLGKHVSEMEPGWFIIWPIIQDVIYMEVTTQVVDLRPQTTRTLDGHTKTLSGALQYRIKNAKNAILNVQDLDKSIETLSLGVILDFIAKKTKEECNDIESIKLEIQKGVKKAARGWGIQVDNVYITDHLDDAINIRLLSNQQLPIEEDE